MSDTSAVVEVRTYYIKPGRRDDFVELFQTRARPALERHGMKVLGLLLDTEDPTAVIWLRSFPTPEARESMKKAFYEGGEWTDELEGLAMPMIDHWEVVVTRCAPGASLGWTSCS